MHGANYRVGNGQPFCRKEFIKGNPQIKIAKFQGGKRATYDYCIQLLINEKVQIRHMAIDLADWQQAKHLNSLLEKQGILPDSEFILMFY